MSFTCFNPAGGTAVEVVDFGREKGIYWYEGNTVSGSGGKSLQRCFDSFNNTTINVFNDIVIFDKDAAAKFQAEATNQAKQADKNEDLDFGSFNVTISIPSTVVLKVTKQSVEFKCVDENNVTVFSGSTKALRTACKEITDKLNSEHNLRSVKQWKITTATLTQDDESTYHFNVT